MQGGRLAVGGLCVGVEEGMGCIYLTDEAVGRK
jgi:hypothetical protein